MGVGETIKKRAQSALLASAGVLTLVVVFGAVGRAHSDGPAPDHTSPTGSGSRGPATTASYDATAGGYNQKHFPEGMRGCNVTTVWHGGHLAVAVTTNPPGIHGAHIDSLMMQSQNGTYRDGASNGLHMTIGTDQRHIANGAGSYLDVVVVAPWGDGATTTAECQERPVPQSTVG